MLGRKSFLNLTAVILLVALPLIIFGQHPTEPTTPHEEGNVITLIFEWVEYLADIVGITILIIGFLKGVYMFIRLELDRLTGQKDYEELFQLRNILGTYIIISLDFLIVSDIIHSVLKPELTELLNLGIIVVMRTAIGFFLGKELHELRKELKVEESEDEIKEHH
jgi:uncharacterized membrane protein